MQQLLVFRIFSFPPTDKTEIDGKTDDEMRKNSKQGLINGFRLSGLIILESLLTLITAHSERNFFKGI